MPPAEAPREVTPAPSEAPREATPAPSEAPPEATPTPAADPTPQPAWVVVEGGAKPRCVAVEVTEEIDASGTPNTRITGSSSALTFRVTGRPRADGLRVDSYSLWMHHFRGGAATAGHCAQLIHESGEPPPADARVYADRTACDRAVAAGVKTTLGPCVEPAIARMRREAPGLRPPAASDPLLRRMRRKARVWVLEGDGCRSWTFRPYDAKDPTKGDIERTWREPDGTRVKHGYGYEYLDRALTLTGPGTEEIHPDGTTTSSGMGCLERVRVEHTKGASEVGGQLWHYRKAGCEAERRREEREEAAQEQKQAPADDAEEVSLPNRGGLGGC